MTTPKHDYKAALEDWKTADDYFLQESGISIKTRNAVIDALRVADRLTQEPSIAMSQAGTDCYISALPVNTHRMDETFKAMVNKLMEEIEK